MEIGIRNFRGVSSADIEHDKLSLIAGRNHNGKSSIAEAIAAVFTGESLPGNILKSQAKKIVRDGTKSASCKISHKGSTALLSWPNCEYITEGKAFEHISKISAGLESVLDIKKKDLGDFLARYIHAEPTLVDLEKELKSVDMSPDVIDKLKKAVEISGFQAIHAKAKETGTKLKGQWELVSGEKFGSSKIESWMPANWYAALSNQTAESLEAKVEGLKKEVEAGIAAEAVAGLEVEQLEAQAKALPALEKDIKMTNKKIENLKQSKIKPQDEFNKLSQLPDEQGCPHCGGLLCVNNGKIEAYAEIKESDIDDRTKNLNSLSSTLDIVDNEIKKLTEKYYIEKEKLEQARNASGEMEKVKKAGSEKYLKNLNEARQKLQDAENDLDAFNTKIKADSFCKAINQNKAIIDILAPDGLRATKLKTALIPFNELLSELSDSASWQNVRLSSEFEILMNDRPIVLCSKSEQFQTRVIFQLALAIKDKAELVLIDGADIIVGKERNGLIQVIQKSGISTIVFMSMGSPDNMPPLEKIGGVCYWIEEGELSNEIKK